VSHLVFRSHGIGHRYKFKAQQCETRAADFKCTYDTLERVRERDRWPRIPGRGEENFTACLIADRFGWCFSTIGNAQEVESSLLHLLGGYNEN